MKKINRLLLVVALFIGTGVSGQKTQDSLITQNNGKNKFVLGLQASNALYQKGIYLGYNVRNKHNYLLTWNPYQYGFYDFKYRYDFYRERNWNVGFYIGSTFGYSRLDESINDSGLWSNSLSFGFTASYNVTNNWLLQGTVGVENIFSTSINKDTGRSYNLFFGNSNLNIGIERRFSFSKSK